jgi:hypothetical protein
MGEPSGLRGEAIVPTLAQLKDGVEAIVALFYPPP